MSEKHKKKKKRSADEAVTNREAKAPRVPDVKPEEVERPPPTTAAPAEATAAASAASSPAKAAAKPRLTVRLAPLDATPPLLVAFQGRPVPKDAADMTFKVLANVADPARKNDKQVVGEGSKVDYWSMNYGKLSHRKDLTRFCVAVLDEATGDLTLHRSGHIFGLQESVHGLAERDNEAAETAAAAAATAAAEKKAKEGKLEAASAYEERRSALVDAFGSKKRQRALLLEEAKIIDAQSAVGAEALGGALAAAAAAAAAASSQGGESGSQGGAEGGAAGNWGDFDGAARAEEESRRSFLPPFHADAATPQGVYLVEELAPPEVLSTIDAEISEQMAAHPGEGGAWLREWKRHLASSGAGTFSKYVLARLRPEAPPKRSVLQQLLFLAHLVAFHNANSKALKNTTQSSFAKELKIPEAVARWLLSRFTEEGDSSNNRRRSFSMSKEDKQRVGAHALCLALVLAGCQLQFEDLATDLRLSSVAAGQLLRQLGCKTAGSGIAKLVVPLQFPTRRKRQPGNK